jgi:glycosyltransferase involved in cell wall biosynthesis
MKVSVICTVLNEGKNVRRLLESLAAQTRQPDEIVIVDGGSTDETVSVLRSATSGLYADQGGDIVPVKVIVEPGANISRGRNVAAAAAIGDVIVSTDAGVWLSSNWLEALTAPYETERAPEVVSGVFKPDADSVFEIAMSATVLPTIEELQPESFLPSSRSVAFTKNAWAVVGGYPEWLDYCEDLIFDLRLKEHFSPFGFAPSAVAHFRPRGSLRAFFRQYFRYARGDGKADLWRKRHLVRYVSYLVGLPLLLLAALYVSPWLALGGAVFGFVGHTYVPYRRLSAWMGRLSWRQRVAAVLWVPLIRAVGDVAKMLGYPVGWLWRLRHWRDHPEIHWRSS